MNPRDDRTPSDLLDDLLHYADYREKPEDNSWREVYKSHGVSADYESEEQGRERRRV